MPSSLQNKEEAAQTDGMELSPYVFFNTKPVLEKHPSYPSKNHVNFRGGSWMGNPLATGAPYGKSPPAAFES